MGAAVSIARVQHVAHCSPQGAVGSHLTRRAFPKGSRSPELPLGTSVPCQLQAPCAAMCPGEAGGAGACSGGRRAPEEQGAGGGQQAAGMGPGHPRRAASEVASPQQF